jgi:RNA polymerase sigma-70 factor (ECF subfamily)
MAVALSMAALRSAAPVPLVDRCIGGDESAWRALHRDFHPQAVRFLRRLGVPAAEAEDLCQEVFIQVFRYLPRFEGRADFRTWLFKLCLSQASRRRRRQAWSLAGRALSWWRGPAESAGAVGPEWSTEEMARRARLALERMKPAHRHAFVLFELEGLPGEEVARVLDCPVATVWRRLSYARREFESWIQEGPLGPAREGTR